MKPLNARALYRSCRLENFDFTSTKSLEPLNKIVGQSRAQEAVRFALSMPDNGYNIYAVGRNGLGKRTMVLRYLSRETESNRAVFDWCYVSNFDDPRSPRVLKLPPSMGHSLKKDLEKLMSRLVQAIPQAFDNDAYYERAEKLKNDYATLQEEALEKLASQAKRKHVDLSVSTPGGYRLTAMNGEEPHTAKSFEGLSKEEQKRFEDEINKLETKLRGVIRKLAQWEQEYADKQQALHEEIVLGVSQHLVDDLIEKYSAQSSVVEYLKSLQKDIIENQDIFLEDREEQAALAYATLDKKMPRRYQINVLVHHDEEQAPVIVEDSPNYHNLFGYVENVTFKGTVFTDFSLIRAGCLHRANGGYLLMDAIKVLEQPFVWDGLKRALRAQEIQINSLEREVTLSGTISLEPEAIPLDVKIVLFGDRDTLLLLQHYDPEFSELFKVTADFENEMDRSAESELLYAKFISSLVHDKGFLHCDRKAVARIIEFSARRAEHQNKLSLHASEITNLLRESNYWAKKQSSRMIRLSHVESALKSQDHRNSRIRDQMFETVKEGVTLLQTTGGVIGQINALTVMTAGGQEFGMPSRVTVNCYYGDGDIVDIEHDAKLGGNIHTKGVLILTSFLSTIFGSESSIPLSASVAFEQSYSEVDGDSASLAEFCALISSFAKIPIRQDLAVTGSVNQFGHVQPVGGVNEKIEGFYQACEIKGSVPTQAVILPDSNVQNLMLDSDVLNAVNRNRFSIYAVKHVDEALKLLTGIEPGKRNKKGEFPSDSLYGRIESRLNQLRKSED